MSLQEITLNLDLDALPEEVAALIKEAENRAEKFYEAGLGLRIRKYIPSDPKVVHAAIACLKNEGHLQGNVFCEWGSGFAIAAGIAALLGMNAYGIELEDELVERSTRLMKDLEIPVEILQTDYLPDGFDESEGHGGKDLILPEERTSRGGEISAPMYDGLDTTEVDLFFVYPWPDQEEMMMDLFSAVASDGAVLLMYQGEGEIAAFLHDEIDDYMD